MNVLLTSSSMRQTNAIVSCQSWESSTLLVGRAEQPTFGSRVTLLLGLDKITRDEQREEMLFGCFVAVQLSMGLEDTTQQREGSVPWDLVQRHRRIDSV